jgi:hypothetical protein
VLDPNGFRVTGGTSIELVPAIASNGRMSFVSWTDYRLDPYSGDLYGVVVGAAPWEGTVDIGDHTVLLRGDGDFAHSPPSLASRKVRVRR